MAGDWIKMRTNLSTDPAVVRMASGLSLDRFGIVGRLHTIWSWANEHLTDGCDVPVDAEFLDSLVATPGFSAEMRRVGWLTGRDGCLSFPAFERHNGNSAKSRAMDSLRKKRVRTESEKCPDNNRTKRGLEKRREEKSIKRKTTSSKKFDPLAVEFPVELSGDDFRGSWQQWCQHRKERRSALTATTVNKQLAMLSAAGVADAIAMIEQSIEKGWTGLFEVKHEIRNNNGNATTAAQRAEQANADAFASLRFEDDD